jgi:hypothetical protein
VAALATQPVSHPPLLLPRPQLDGKVGGRLEDTQLVHGIVLDKEMSHPQVGGLGGRADSVSALHGGMNGQWC